MNQCSIARCHRAERSLVSRSAVPSPHGLELLVASTPGHDARARDGRLVEIKATQGKMVGLRDEPRHLLVLRLHPDGTFDEVYDGAGAPVWAASGPMQKNGQRAIGLGKLSKLMAEVDGAERLPRWPPTWCARRLREREPQSAPSQKTGQNPHPLTPSPGGRGGNIELSPPLPPGEGVGG